MKLNFSLKQTWTFIVLFAVTVPAITLTVWYGVTTYNFQLNSSLSIEQHTNTQLRSQIEAEIKRFRTLLKNKSDPLAFLVTKIDKPESLREIYTLLKLIVDREIAIHEAMVLSREGDVIADVDPGMNIFGKRILSPKERELVAARAGFDSNKKFPEVIVPLFGRTFIGPPKLHDNKFAFSIAVPIGKPVKAILVAIIDVDKLWLVDNNNNEKTKNYLLDQRGTLLTDINSSEFKTGDLLTHLSIARTALINGEWHAESSYIGVNNQSVYGTLTTINTLSWALISEVNANEILNPIWTSLLSILIPTLLGLIFFIWIVLRLTNKTLEPIQYACEAIDHIAKGSYDFYLSPTGIHELDDMTSGIIQMTKARRKVEIALKNKEKEQSDMLNSMVDAVISIDEYGIVLSFNKSAEKLFGYKPEDILGHNINCLMPEPFAEEHDGYLLRYLQTGEARIIGTGREVFGKHKDNKTFPMRLFVAELPKGEDDTRRFIGTCSDITINKQQEEQLRRSQKMDALGKLTGGIAHDFNNLLGIITGYAELLEMKLSDQPELSNHAHEIIHAGNRGEKLTKKLLSFSRDETLEAKKLNINKLLQNQQDMLQKTLTVRIELIYELEQNVWPICLDNSDLEDAILNMCINAMHAMNDKESGAKLTIRTNNFPLSSVDALPLEIEPGDYVILSLTDTGNGIEKTTLEKIFDPFFTTKGKLGTGLGLSQVFGFIKRAGGTIKVHSEPDHGSQFILYFPRHFDNTNETDNSDIPKDNNTKGHERVLVVDDEEGLRKLCSELLSMQGYKVLSAENGLEALKILEKEPIDLLLTDIIMPEMDGYQLASAVQEKYPLIKILLASGYNDERHKELVKKELHENLLHKPYSAHTLRRKIRALLDE